MLTKFKFVLSAFFAIALLASCANSEAGDAAKAEAREAIEPSTAAQPQAPAQPAATTPAAPTGPTTTVDFKETTFDFGTVVSGEKVSHVYSFTNTGSEPLIISNAKGSCGCTVPNWPKEPIAVGGTGEIEVVFDSKNKKGPRNQKVTITANTDPPQTFIYLKGEVTPAEGTPAGQ
jgi:hypothetical protein